MKLSDARTADEVLDVLARRAWHTAHDGAECPPARIPAPEDLVAWRSEWPADVMAECAQRLTKLLQASLPASVLGGIRLDQSRAHFKWELKDGVIEAVAVAPCTPPDPANVRRMDPDSPRVYQRGLPIDSWWFEYNGSEITISLFVRLTNVHVEWCKSRQLPHPIAPLVNAWQQRPPTLAAATVTTTLHDCAAGGMIRRPTLVSTLRRVHWIDDPLVTGAVVDGEPMAALRADTADLFPVRKRRPRRRFKPGEQRTLALPVVPSLHHDLRLIALADLSGDPALQGDVLALMAFAWAADRPLNVTGFEGAALLARALDGTPRVQIKSSDITRFWEATAALRALVARDPAGTGAWANLATVEVPHVHPVDRVTVGPPAWARAGSFGKWTLTAEASAASIARGVSGKQGMAGRIITGIEYRLAAGWTGRAGTVAPDLRPADRRRKASAGPVVELDWRTVLVLAGDWWDQADQKKDDAAYFRYKRAVATLRKRGYFVPATPRGEAPAGDSVEIVDQVRAHRGRHAGLLVRASARFVEAARLAQLPHWRGFETRKLTDWVGLVSGAAAGKSR